MQTPPNTMQNHLLGALPAAEFQRLAAHLEAVQIPLGKALFGPAGPSQYAYFPTTAIVSLQYILQSGASAETAGVGNEGMVGTSLFLGENTSPRAAVVQTAGHAYRLERHWLLQEFDRAGALQQLLLRFSQALATQMSQIAACNWHHSVEQHLCRWLLLTLDRMPGSELIMTQELAAGMLGVRREGITEIAGKLKRAGVISYQRGHISVLDRSGLEARTCECYGVIRNELNCVLAAAGRHQRDANRLAA